MVTINYDTPGAFQYADGGRATMMPPNYGASAPAPAPTPQTEPTIGTALSGGIDRESALNTLGQARTELESIQSQLDNMNAGGGQDLAIGEYSPYPSFDEIYGAPINDEAVNRNTLKMFQSQIDATNQVYDQLLNEAKMQGEGRIGSQRAIAARGGILGSDFAGAQKEKVQQYNTDIYRGIGAERQAAIGAILGTARQTAQNEIANKRAARQQGAENYLNYLAGASERRQSNIGQIAGALLEQGIDPNDAEEDINAVAREAGVTPDDIKQAYYQLVAQQQAAVTEDGGDTYKFFSGSGGLYRTNPKTGDVEFVPGGSGGSGGSSSVKFTATQRNKLEQAGLTNASRQDQLDYLFGDADTEGGFDAAREIIQQNPQLTDDEIKASLLENTNLGVTEINTLLSTRDNREIPDFETKIDQLAQKIFENFDSIEDARSYVSTGKIVSGGKSFQLTDEQKEQLNEALEGQRSFWQKLVPGGK